MKPFFADTSFYIALLNQDDELFPLVKPFAEKPDLLIVTTEFVFIEVANFFARSRFRQRAVDLYSRLSTSTFTRIVPASSELFVQGITLYGSRRDKDWSLTDCCSFNVMEQLKLDEALSSDKHFEQAGFQYLLKP